MKNMRGFSSFEFYFVISVIGIIVLFGIKRYQQLAELSKHYAFEVLAQNFNTSVYNLHAQWILAQSRAERADVVAGPVPVQGLLVYFSDTGWPIAAVPDPAVNTAAPIKDAAAVINSAAATNNSTAAYLRRPAVSLATCKSLWHGLLKNPASLSYEGGDAYGSHPYHLSLTSARNCRFELTTKTPGAYFFDYSIVTGQINLHTPPITKDS